MLYVTGPQNVAWALDARTGRQIWRYRRELPAGLTACCGLVNRGFGVLGDRLFMITLDAHLLALDMKTGAVIWDATMEEYKNGYAATIAPLVVKDKVIVGVAGGEYGIRGFIDAYDAQTGKRAWRFYTIPGPGEPGNETWAGDSWKTRRREHLGHGRLRSRAEPRVLRHRQPGPDYHSDSREGDNLYSDSLVALDVDTGKLRWHYQFTPHDVHDWDSTQVPILADLTIAGQPRKVVMFANRNGFYYTLDRTNGRIMVAKPYVKRRGRPRSAATAGPCCCPATRRTKGRGHVSRHHRRHEFLAAVLRSGDSAVLRQRTRSVHDYYAWKPEYMPGDRFTGGAGQRVHGRGQPVYGALRAIDPATGRAQVGVQVPQPLDRRAADHRVGLIFSGDSEATSWRWTRAAASCCGATRWARTCTARRRSPTCWTADSTCSSRRHDAHGVGAAAVVSAARRTVTPE